MTVDIARATGNALAALDGGNDALGRLAQWVEAARNAHQLVAPLVDTAFVPENYRPKVDPRATPEQKEQARQTAIATATAAVLQGLSLGLDPLVSLQQIYLVHGRPGMYARIKVALVTAHGHEVWTEELTATRAVVCGRRKGTEYVERVTVTMDMARSAKWTTNEAYSKTPMDMLYARAASRVCDRIAADVLMGIASVEEIQDEIKAEASVGKRTVTPPVKRAAIEATVEEPPLEPEPTPAAEPVDISNAEPAMTKPQTGKLFALLKEKGLEDRELALEFLSQTIGRPIESTKEMTKRDAMKAIDALEKLDAPNYDEPALDLDDQGGDDQPELEP